MSSEIENLPNLTDEIKNYIYTIRGRQVILDSEIARLYEVETKKLNQAVKRNINRFPEHFCFKLTENEYESLRSQFVTLKIQGRGQHSKYLPYAFTEQGVAMLSAVLHSDRAVDIRKKGTRTKNRKLNDFGRCPKIQKLLIRFKNYTCEKWQLFENYTRNYMNQRIEQMRQI